MTKVNINTTKNSQTNTFFSNLDRKWAEMLEYLPENDVRYVIIDIFYETKEGSRTEIYFISWYKKIHIALSLTLLQISL